MSRYPQKKHVMTLFIIILTLFNWVRNMPATNIPSLKYSTYSNRYGTYLQTSSECSRQALSSKDKGYIVSMDWLRVVIKRGYTSNKERCACAALRTNLVWLRMVDVRYLHRVATFHQLARNVRIRPCEQVTPRACDPSSRASPFKI